MTEMVVVGVWLDATVDRSTSHGNLGAQGVGGR